MLETFLQQLADTPKIEWVAMVAGIAGVYLSIKEKVSAWPLFILCYSIYVYIGYHSGLHAFLGMNVVFIGISIYGWLKWARVVQAEADDLLISRTSKAHWPLVVTLLLVGTGGIGWLLSVSGDAKLPYLDAFATCCGFIAQWMLSRKHIETWVFWIITDIIYLGIFAYGQSWPSVILFTVFIGLAIKGWNEWQKGVSKVA